MVAAAGLFAHVHACHLMRLGCVMCCTVALGLTIQQNHLNGKECSAENHEPSETHHELKVHQQRGKVQRRRQYVGETP